MDQHWNDLSAHLKLSDESRARIRAQLAARSTRQGDISIKKKTLHLRAPLVAAALAAALVVTALAVELTVGWESFLGRTPKEAVTPVGVSAVTGDYTLTLQESIVDDDGAAFLLALTRNDGEALEGKPELYHWDVKVDGEFPDMGMETHQPILSDGGKTAYFCVEFEAQGEEWDKERVTGRTVTFQCDGVVDMDWSEEERAMTRETVSLAPLAQIARQIDMSYSDICKGENKQILIGLVEELSAQATVPLTRTEPKTSQISAVFFTSDGYPMVAVSDWDGAIRQGQYLTGYGTAAELTDIRTGERWGCNGSVKREKAGSGFFLSGFQDCPLTQEDLPYMEVTISYSMDKLLSDQPVELSFVAGDGYQTTVALDEDIAFNYIGDCTARVTGAKLSALRLELTFDRMERSGWEREDHPQKNTQWAVVEKDGTRVPLSPPMIRQDEKTGAGYIRLEGVDANYDRRLIDPGQVAALLIGDTELPLQ